MIRVWHHSSGPASFSKSGTIQQVWHRSASLAPFSKSGTIQQVWHHSASLAPFSKSGTIQQIWHRPASRIDRQPVFARAKLAHDRVGQSNHKNGR
jgi:hypothetical protein